VLFAFGKRYTDFVGVIYPTLSDVEGFFSLVFLLFPFGKYAYLLYCFFCWKSTVIYLLISTVITVESSASMFRISPETPSSVSSSISSIWELLSELLPSIPEIPLPIFAILLTRATGTVMFVGFLFGGLIFIFSLSLLSLVVWILVFSSFFSVPVRSSSMPIPRISEIFGRSSMSGQDKLFSHFDFLLSCKHLW